MCMSEAHRTQLTATNLERSDTCSNSSAFPAAYLRTSVTRRAGVMCLDFHPQHPHLLAVGCYDGSVLVYDMRSKVQFAAYGCGYEASLAPLCKAVIGVSEIGLSQLRVCGSASVSYECVAASHLARLAAT